MPTDADAYAKGEKTFPILIGSKGRPENKIFKWLMEAGDTYEWYVFVEPQDWEKYAAVMPESHLLNIEGNDRGFVYMRQFVLDWATRGLREGRMPEWYWMLDDDIDNFYEYTKGKATKRGLEVLTLSQPYFANKPNIAQASLDYQQFAWSSKVPFKMNGYADVCVCINAQKSIGCRFRKEVEGKLDRDFTLQLLANGYDTLRMEKYAFSCPKNGTNKGGFFDYYQSGKEEKDSKAMVDMWGPHICQFHVKPDGRPDVRINWGFFKKKQ